MLRHTHDLALRALAVLIALTLAAALTAREGSAQQLPPRLELPPASPGPCESLEDGDPALSDASDEARAQARVLLLEANQAAILGDDGRARELLRRAADLDPSSGEIAYRLGRILEDAGEPEAALAEYCRHLRLAPDGPDALEVEGLVAVLGGAREGAIPAQARIAFELGLEAMNREDHPAAALHFSRALVEFPEWPAAHYNRALAYLESGREAAGRADLERYLELQPDAPHSDAAAALVRSPTEGPASTPRTALMSGLVVPGMGYMVSGRPRAGALVLGGAGAAAAIGLLYTRVDVTCRVPPVDDQCPPGQVAERTEERPFLASGLAAAAVVTVLGAVHAARSVRSASTVLSLDGKPALRVELDALSGARWDVMVEVAPLGRSGASGRWGEGGHRGPESVEASLRIRF